MQGPKWPFLLILIVYGPGVVIVNLLGQVCTLSRAPRTKKTLPDFHERCRVTRHSRVFHGLMGCQRTPRFSGVTKSRRWKRLRDGEAMGHGHLEDIRPLNSQRAT